MPVAIPNPVLIAPDCSYFGYPKLPGVLVFDLLPELGAEDESQLRHDWVNIARVIHTEIPLDVATKLSVPVFDPTQICELACKVEGDPVLSDSVREFADKAIEAVSKIDVAREELYFLHNDLHFKNILADPGTKRIIGVLDWSDCCIAPIAREFAVWEWGHDGSLQRVAGMYEAATGIGVDIEQAKLWKHLEELADLVEQKERGDESGAGESLAHIEGWIAEADRV